MTPNEKTRLRDDAQTRAMEVLAPAADKKLIDCERYVEGYAAKYEPYVLYEDEDGPVYEKFERNAFKDCDMSDVIFQFDHVGRVLARQSNGSLIVQPNEVGLFIAGNLGITDAARQIYDDIRLHIPATMSS